MPLWEKQPSWGKQGGVVVKRERVTDASGRRWVSGELDPDAYFTQARERARRTARATLAARLTQAHAAEPQR